MGPPWGSPGSCRPHMGPINLAIRDVLFPQRNYDLYSITVNLKQPFVDEIIYFDADIGCSALVVLCRSRYQLVVDSPHKGAVRENFWFVFILDPKELWNKQLKGWWFHTQWDSLAVTLMAVNVKYGLSKICIICTHMHMHMQWQDARWTIDQLIFRHSFKVKYDNENASWEYIVAKKFKFFLTNYSSDRSLCIYLLKILRQSDCCRLIQRHHEAPLARLQWLRILQVKLIQIPIVVKIHTTLTLPVAYSTTYGMIYFALRNLYEKEISVRGSSLSKLQWLFWAGIFSKKLYLV